MSTRDGSDQAVRESADEPRPELHVHTIPARTLPIRGFEGIFGGRAKDDASASHAVGTGYRVVDQFLREGERAASTHWQPLADDADVGQRKTKTELTSAISRVLDGLSDLGAFGLQLAEALARPDPPECHADPATAGPFATEGAANAASAPQVVHTPLTLKVAVCCDRSAELTVRLDTQQATQLTVTPLCDAQGKLPSISGISLVREDGPRAIYCVRAVLKPELASGTYHGVVLADGKPAGTLTLTF